MDTFSLVLGFALGILFMSSLVMLAERLDKRRQAARRPVVGFQKKVR